VRWKVGSGSRILFWEDKWTGDRSLKEAYPWLYANTYNKDKTISKYGKWDNDRWEWILSWIRHWFEWEKPQIETFLEEIDTKTLVRGRSDIWMRNHGEDMIYTVKSVYNLLQGSCPSDKKQFFEDFWRVKVIPSTKFFVWRTILNGVPIMINLRHRRVFLNNVSCVMCGEQDKTINHLLITYKVTTNIWNMCNKWIGNLGVSHNQIQAHFEHFLLLELDLKGNML